MKMERIDKVVTRIVEGDQAIGFALLLTNGKWGAFDLNQNRLTPEKFLSARMVMAFFEQRSPKEAG